MTLNRLLVTTALACLTVLGISCGSDESEGNDFPFSVGEGRTWTYHLATAARTYVNGELMRWGSDTIWFENQKFAIGDTVGALDGPFFLRRDSMYIRPGAEDQEFYSARGVLRWTDGGLVYSSSIYDTWDHRGLVLGQGLLIAAGTQLVLKYPAQTGNTWEYVLSAGLDSTVTIQKEYIGFGEVQAGGLTLNAHHVRVTFPHLDLDSAREMTRNEFYDSHGLVVVEVLSRSSRIDSTLSYYYPQHVLVDRYDSICWRRTGWE